jgi:hypothetical protein
MIGYLRDSEHSLLLSELVHAASDVLKFVNDRAYQQAFNTANAIQYEKIEHLLAFLDTAEVLLEVGASMMGGEMTKWVVVSTIQVLKY